MSHTKSDFVHVGWREAFTCWHGEKSDCSESLPHQAVNSHLSNAIRSRHHWSWPVLPQTTKRLTWHRRVLVHTPSEGLLICNFSSYFCRTSQWSFGIKYTSSAAGVEWMFLWIIERIKLATSIGHVTRLQIAMYFGIVLAISRERMVCCSCMRQGFNWFFVYNDSSARNGKNDQHIPCCF